MATTTINAALEGKSQKYYEAGLVLWTGDVRDATTGTFTSTFTSTSGQPGAFGASLQASRSGYAGTCARSFLFFNNFGTGVAGNITSAQIKIYNTSPAQTTDSILVESTAWNGNGADTTLDNADYSAIDHSRAYSSLATSWSAGYNTITLNANAIQDMNSNGYFNMALIEGTYDYGDTNPSTGVNVFGGVGFQNSNAHQLNLTYSTGFSDDINGVSSGDIVSVNGIATANIASFNGVNA